MISIDVGYQAMEARFERVDGLRVGVIGDFCLDVYWHADMRISELSRETPHFPLPIVQERMQPGGAGNVACNLAALKPTKVIALSVLGKDWRGAELRKLLTQEGVDVGALIEAEDRVTNAYVKPMRKGISETVYEDPRLDFENREPLQGTCEDALLAALDRSAPQLDVLCVCDQLKFGCITPRVRARICELGAGGLTIFVDSRDRIAEYRHVIIKPNEVELCRALGVAATLDAAELQANGRAMAKLTGRPVLMTLGEHGCMVVENERVSHVAAFPVKPPLDICGAGDTFMSALALFYAAGADLVEAAVYAACSASLTVQKINMTGVTTRDELRGRVAEYVQSSNNQSF